MAVFNETFDSVPDGVAISTSNSSYDAIFGSRTQVGDTTLVKRGTASLAVDGTGTTSLEHEFTGAAVTTHYRRMYIYLRTAPGANTPLYHFLTGAAAMVLDVRITTGRALQCRNSSSVAQATSSGAGLLPLNEWARVEIGCVAGNATLRVFTGADLENAVGSYSQELTWTYATTSIGEVRLGATASTSIAYNMDDEAANDTTWLGPTGAPAAPANTTILSVTNQAIVRSHYW